MPHPAHHSRIITQGLGHIVTKGEIETTDYGPRTFFPLPPQVREKNAGKSRVRGTTGVFIALVLLLFAAFVVFCSFSLCGLCGLLFRLPLSPGSRIMMHSKPDVAQVVLGA